MYLTSFSIERVKCFERAEFTFPRRGDGRYAGWHVLLGANATGKTTALRAMAVALMGPTAWRGFEPVGWVRDSAEPTRPRLVADISRGEADAFDNGAVGPYRAEIGVIAEGETDDEGVEGPQFALEGDKAPLLKSVYATRKQGWFSCGYGPYRRLSGGSAEALAGLNHARQIRVASLFRESVALTQCEEWLKDLDHRARDKTNPNTLSDAITLYAVQDVINSMLPDEVKLAQISSAGLRFETTASDRASLSDLSDGYRSFLAFAIDLVRQFLDGGLTLSRPEDALISLEPKATGGLQRRFSLPALEGVVFIDEVDAHLHPTWQRRIGPMLQRVFPNVQFIVTTHSPFVAQSASEGGLFVLAPAPDRSITVVQPVASVKGWRADALLTSPLFGLSDTVDLDTEQRAAEYHDLASRRAFETLSDADQKRLDALEVELSHTFVSPGETVADFERRQRADAFVDEVVKGLETRKAG